MFIIPVQEYMNAVKYVDEVVDEMFEDLMIEETLRFCEECCLELSCEMRPFDSELCPGCDCDTVLEDVDPCDEDWDDWDEDYEDDAWW